MKEFVTFLLISLSLCFSKPIEYTNVQHLSDAYELSWVIKENSLYIKMNVATTGWVGFGIGEQTSGSMPGSDIVTAYVDNNGNGFISDRYALGFQRPEEDSCQNWDLLSFSESNGRTVIEAKRLLLVNDNQDRNITAGVQQIVWAYGSSDTFSFHGNTKGTYGILFYGDDLSHLVENEIKEAQIFTIAMNYTHVDPVVTDYQCGFFLMPTDQDYHMIAFEVQVDPNAKSFLHHFVLYACDNNNTSWFSSDLQDFRSCHSMENEECDWQTIWGWAPGQDWFFLPKEAGLRFGKTNGSFKTLMLQIHYHNPTQSNNLYDNSIVNIYYTKNLRKYDGGVVILGNPGPNAADIPSNKITHYEFDCPEICTQNLPHSLNIYSFGLHMHETGKQTFATQWRNNSLVREMNRIDFWSFHLQQSTHVNMTLQPGDRINYHCTFDTFDRSDPTKFGSGSRDEMCLAFVGYYPRVSWFQGCGYERDRRTNKNYTLCGNQLMDLSNPTSNDPISFQEVEFGKSSLTCPLSSNGTTTSNFQFGQVTKFDMVGHVLGVFFGILLAIVFVLIVAKGCYNHYQKKLENNNYQQVNL